MIYTETHFGLISIDGRISADGGKTFLENLDDGLIKDICDYLEVNELSFQETSDLQEIFE